MTDRKVMQMALEALELDAYGEPLRHESRRAIAALRARLAEPEPEPVAWQERQLIDSTGQWSHWYECRPRMAHQPLEQLEPNGLMYQWRALHARPINPPTRRPLTDESGAKTVRIPQCELRDIRMAVEITFRGSPDWQQHLLNILDARAALQEGNDD